jgi:predicted O-methyltransferase YrrM
VSTQEVEPRRHGIPQVELTIGGVRFLTGAYSQPTDQTTFGLMKSEAMIERLRRLLAEFTRPNIVEIGIYYGGSVALLSVLADPTKLVSLELSPTPIPVLDEYIATHGLGDRVRPHYGIDQGDRETVSRIADDEFGDVQLDLVIDDASHDYVPTLASFECLFPRLRPGGVYLIEDWRRFEIMDTGIRRLLDHAPDDQRDLVESKIAEAYDTPPSAPLSRLGHELLLAQATGSGLVDELHFDPHWIVARRGPAELDPRRFRLHDVVVDQFGTLAPPPDAWPGTTG